jgi:hypothetical protein
MDRKSARMPRHLRRRRCQLCDGTRPLLAFAVFIWHGARALEWCGRGGARTFFCPALDRHLALWPHTLLGGGAQPIAVNAGVGNTSQAVAHRRCAFDFDQRCTLDARPHRSTTSAVSQCPDTALPKPASWHGWMPTHRLQHRQWAGLSPM